MTGTPWTLRPFREGDEHQIRALFESAFGEELGVERWDWQYQDHYTGLIFSVVAVNDKDEIVGHYAARPVRMKVDDQVRMAMLTVDAMVRADYRKQGMFVHLGAYLHQVAAEQGVPLLYAFPQETSSHAFYTRLDWVKLYNRVPLYIKVLDAGRVLASRLGSSLLLSVATPLGNLALRLLGASRQGEMPPGCCLEEVSRFDEGVDHLWRKASMPHRILLVRDQEYLNWRFVDNPTEEYTLLQVRRGHEVAGYAVLKREERFGLQVGYIMDMLVSPDEPAVATGLVAGAVERFRELGVGMVGCLMLEHTWYVGSLQKNGFFRVPDRIYPQVLTLGVYRCGKEYAHSFITDPHNWFVTFGDHDYV